MSQDACIETASVGSCARVSDPVQRNTATKTITTASRRVRAQIGLNKQAQDLWHDDVGLALPVANTAERFIERVTTRTASFWARLRRGLSLIELHLLSTADL